MTNHVERVFWLTFVVLDAWLAYWTLLLGIRDGLIRRRIRKHRYTQSEATGAQAIAHGMILVVGGLAFLFVALVCVYRVFLP